MYIGADIKLIRLTVVTTAVCLLCGLGKRTDSRCCKSSFSIKAGSVSACRWQPSLKQSSVLC